MAGEFWSLKITISSTSQVGLVAYAAEHLKRALGVLQEGKLPAEGAGGGSPGGGDSRSFSFEVVTPVRARIARLRAEADRLERQLEVESPEEWE